MVGRDRDLAALLAVFDRAWDGRMLVLVGDVGSGKSALLLEFAAQAVLAGRSVVRLACADSDTPGGVLRQSGRTTSEVARTGSSRRPQPESVGGPATGRGVVTSEHDAAGISGEAVQPPGRCTCSRPATHAFG